ncbi:MULTISPECIES: CAP domain-containing protein [Halococcus]|uniref:SCP domain-containing protein n=1 Tax=Halococcus salifodinae DSM 8989 TaxID=1227456 RepID=M0N797_9EURY|nr:MULTISPECIES: CAP domain-containing protein [Halococcus]EMA53433.1 hypothetical protein C450_08982 [Halococcus salifodinae DSM 8989]
MLRSVAGLLAWVVSVVLRLAFVVVIIGLAAGFAFGGGDLPTSVDELSEDVRGLGDAAADSVGELGGVGGVSGVESGDVAGNASVPQIPDSDASELNGTRVEYLVHQEVNEERVEHNRSKLTFDTELRPVARYHSADMANRSYFAHVGPEGETLGDRYAKFNYQCRVPTSGFKYATGGENILYTYYDAPVRMDDRSVNYDTPEALAQGIVNGWMNSTSHRENLLKPYWRQEAIGVYVQQTDGRTRVYATQNFC